MPEVSIIIPTRNRKDLLISAINSALFQTFQNYEIIVVDDCSEDDTQIIVKGINNRKIRYIRHDVTRGEAASRNTGIKNARGQFIAFLDDDDEWLPEKLALQVELLENKGNQVGAVYTGYWIVNWKNKEIVYQKIPKKRGDIYKDLLRENVIGIPSTVMLRREVINKIGLFDESLAYYVDYDFLIRMSKYFNLEYIKKPLVKYNVHENMLSRNPHQILKGLKDFRRKYSNKDKEKLSNIFIGKAFSRIGMSFCNNNNMQLGRKLLVKSIQKNPFQYKIYIYLMSSFFGNDFFHRIRFIRKNIRAQLNKITKFRYIIA